MKFILFFSLFLSLGLSIISQEEDSECRKKWKQFNEQVKAELCKPDKTDDSIVTALVECHKLNDQNPNNTQRTENENKIYELCGTPNEDDIKGFTKVDLKNEKNKKLLMHYCSDKMHTCFHDKIKQLKESGQIKKPENSNKSKMNEQMDEMKNCIKKALNLQN